MTGWRYDARLMAINPHLVPTFLDTGAWEGLNGRQREWVADVAPTWLGLGLEGDA